MRQDEFLKDYRRRLIKAFDACKMKESKEFFKQINENKKIILNNDLNEGIQVENIINYYYLIEQKSLLSEMKRMNYQSKNALLIMEKLEIDIAWEKRKNLNEEFKGLDEKFNRLLNKT